MTHNNTYRKNCFVKKKIPPNLIVNRLVYKYKSSSTILSPQFFLSSSPPPFLPPPPVLLLLFFSLVQKHLHGRYCVYNRSRTRFQNAGNYSEIDGLTMSVPVARRPLCQVREVFNNYEGSPSRRSTTDTDTGYSKMAGSLNKIYAFLRCASYEWRRRLPLRAYISKAVAIKKAYIY